MWKWYKKQGVTIRAAIIGGAFAIFAAILTGAIELMRPNPPIVIQLVPTENSISTLTITRDPSIIQTAIISPTITPTPDSTIVALYSLAATPNPSFAPIIRENDGAEQVYVPSGWFIAGDIFDKGYDDETAHLTYTDEYWIDRFLVTNIQFAYCIEAGACTRPGKSGSHVRPEGYFNISAFDDYPVMEISWQQAQAFCEWRGGRLPTEAEFEKAAGWNPVNGEVSLYPWGNIEPDATLANYDGVDRDTTPINRYPNGISAVGAYDMAGNLWQWTADWYAKDYYTNNLAWENPTGPDGGTYKVIRGGSWYSSDIRWLRVSNRGKNMPENAGNEIGFRCVFDE